MAASFSPVTAGFQQSLDIKQSFLTIKLLKNINDFLFYGGFPKYFKYKIYIKKTFRKMLQLRISSGKDGSLSSPPLEHP